jgi:hypothetical protein
VIFSFGWCQLQITKEELMSRVFRHYRQVRIVQNGTSAQPQVQAVETIYRDGKRQVRCWTGSEQKDWEIWPEPIGSSVAPLVEVFLNRDLPGFSEPFPEPGKLFCPDRTPRKIDYEVVNPGSRAGKPGWDRQWQPLQSTWRQGTRKLQRMLGNIPAALKAAWLELQK